MEEETLCRKLLLLPYTDVLNTADAWANKYIEYCTAQGIVSGVGGNRFAPASSVTGTQLAKMLLVSWATTL